MLRSSDRSALLGIAVALVCAGCAADGSIDLLGTGGTTSSSSVTTTTDATSTASTGTGGACPTGMESCGGTCVDTDVDPSFCGNCETSCGHYQYCQGGQCHCQPGMTMCNGGCVDFASNPDHCGACNHPCGAGEKCEDMGCHTGTCTPPLTGCAASNNRLACVTIADGYPFCGACDVVCAPTEVCVGNHCQAYEPAAPCHACPCMAECSALVDPTAACCAGLYGGVDPICVAGGACP